MPNIRTYQGKDNAPVAGNADQSAAGTGQANAEGIEGLGDPVAKGMQTLGAGLVNYAEQNETSKLAADASTAQADLTTQWAQVHQQADPNDTQVAQRFMDQVVTPRLDQIGQDVSTRTGKLMWEKVRAGLQADMFTKTAADQASLAGDAQVQNMMTVMNNASSTVMSDPTAFNSVMAMKDLAIEGAVRTGGLPSSEAVKLRTDMNKQIAVGTIYGINANGGPDQAQAALDSGRFDSYLDASSKEELQLHINRSRTAQTEQQRAQLAAQKQAGEQDFDTKAAAIMGSVIQPDGTLALPPNYYSMVATQLQGHPYVKQGTVEAALNFGRSLTADAEKGIPSKDDPATYDNFQQRMSVPPGQPGALTLPEIYQARANHLLSDSSMSVFKGNVEALSKDPAAAQNNRDFNALMAGYKQYIDTTDALGQFTRPQGAQAYYEFSLAARQTFDADKRAGKSPSQIETEVRKLLPRYQMNQQGRMGLATQNMTNGAQPLPVIAPATPRQPGETIADWTKRTGGK